MLNFFTTLNLEGKLKMKEKKIHGFILTRLEHKEKLYLIRDKKEKQKDNNRN